jgi:hypothetical protein
MAKTENISIKGLIQKQQLDNLNKSAEEQVQVLKNIESHIQGMDMNMTNLETTEEKSLKLSQETARQEKRDRDDAIKQAKLDSANRIKEAIANTSAMTQIALNTKTYKGPIEKIGDKLKSFGDKFSSVSNTLNTLGIVKKGTGGIVSNILEKREDKKEFIKSQQLLGNKSSKSEIAKDFNESQKLAKLIAKNEALIKKQRGTVEESDFFNTREGYRLENKRTKLSSQFSSLDLRNKSKNNKEYEPSIEPIEMSAPIGTPTVVPTESNEDKREAQGHEAKIEKTLEQIEVNTRPVLAPTTSAIPASIATPTVAPTTSAIPASIGTPTVVPTTSAIPAPIGTPTVVPAESNEDKREAQGHEAKIEKTLEQIEVNTRPVLASNAPKEADKSSGLGGLLGGLGLTSMLSGLKNMIGGLFEGIGKALLSAFKLLFSPTNILKGLVKGFALGTLIASIGKGIYDGFIEWQKSGDIGKAIVEGLGGMIEFLTFGLISKDKYKEYAKWFNGKVDEYIIQPITTFINDISKLFDEWIATPLKTAFSNIGNFFSETMDSFMSIIQGIGIPEIDLSSISKWIPGAPDKIGPWYPFASTDTEKITTNAPTKETKPVIGANDVKAEQTPTKTGATYIPYNKDTASSVYQKSAENVDKKEDMATKGGGNTVVSAPTVNTSNSTVNSTAVRLPSRNPDTTSSRYISSRYAI